MGQKQIYRAMIILILFTQAILGCINHNGEIIKSTYFFPNAIDPEKNICSICMEKSLKIKAFLL